MKWLMVVSFVFICVKADAQAITQTHIDSFELKLKATKNDRAKLPILKLIFFHYLNNDSKKALGIATEGLNIAQRLKSNHDICDFYDEIGESYLYLDNNKLSLEYFNKDYELAGKIGYKQQMALALNDMGGVYQNQSEDVKSQQTHFQALKIWEELKDYRQVAVCYVNIGVTYNNQLDYKKAIFFGKKAVEVINRSNHHDVDGNAYGLIGNSYAALNDTASAHIYLGHALTFYKKHNNKFGVATILYLLASTYPGNYAKELQLGLEGQKLWDQIAPQNFYSINNLGNLGSVYGQMAMHQHEAAKSFVLYNKSEIYLLKAIALAKKTNTPSPVMDYSDSLAMIEAARGKFKEAYLSLMVHDKLADSIYSQGNKNKIASLEGKHEIELRDKQLLINKLEITNQQKQRWFLIGGLVTLLLIAGLILNQSAQRKKANKALSLLNEQLDEANKVKTRFFSILNHDLRSPIASFVNFLHLQQNAPDLLDEDARVAYSKKATASAEKLLSTMEDLLLWSKGQMENFKPHMQIIPVSELFTYIEVFFEESPVKIKYDHPAGMSINTDEHYIKTIMQNLTNNCIKALKNSTAGVIEWKAWQDGNGAYLSIKDNGPGADEEALKALYDATAPIGIKSGLGLHIIRDLAKAIKCSIRVHAANDEGLELILRF